MLDNAGSCMGTRMLESQLTIVFFSADRVHAYSNKCASTWIERDSVLARMNWLEPSERNAVT